MIMSMQGPFLQAKVTEAPFFDTLKRGEMGFG